MSSEPGQGELSCNVGLWSASEAGGPSLDAPTAAQEQPLMTRDLLDRLIAADCRPAGGHLRPCGYFSAQRSDIADLTCLPFSAGT